MTMMRNNYLIFSITSLLFLTVRTQDDEILSNYLFDSGMSMEDVKDDLYLMEDKVETVTEKVDIKLYYECLCPDCRIFDTMHLRPTVEKLASNLNLHLYPYGNAETTDRGNGNYEFKCQHGPEECYGNKLHACAIDFLRNNTKAVFFNSCLMDSARKGRGSDDAAADECGRIMNIPTDTIKQCAKGYKGTVLLKHYGDESKKVGFKYVPYILINGVVNDGQNFMKDICAAFKSPPPECAEVNKNKRY
nr:GILT-like protein 2 [Helicoverpa armigera]